MRKQHICILIALIFTIIVTGCSDPIDNTSKVPHQAPPGNLVKNGDLETSSDGKPEHWESFDFGGSPPGEHGYQMDPTERNQSISVKLNQLGAAGWKQSISLEPDSHYLMTCRAKTTEVEGRGLGASMFFPRFRYMQPPSARVADDWTILSAELVNSGFVEMDLVCSLGAYGGNTGSAIFDDISIKKIPNPATDPKLTEAIQWGPFKARYNLERGYLTSLMLENHQGDEALDFLGSYPTLPHLNHGRDHFFGDVAVDIKTGDTWQRYTTADTSVTHAVDITENRLETTHQFPADQPVPEITTAWNLDGDILSYSIIIMNTHNANVQIGSVDLPMPWNTNYCLFDPHDKNSQRLLYTRRVAEHKHISGVSSYIIACPMDGSMPFIAVTPGDDQSGIEFTYHSPDTIRNQRRDNGRWLHGAWPGLTRICFHSQGIKETRNWDDWRLGHTSIKLAPGDSKIFTLHFRELNHRSEIPEAVAASAGLGIQLIPGPAVPVNEPVEVKVTNGTPPYTFQALSPGGKPSNDALTKIADTTFTLNKTGEHVITIFDSTGKSASLIMMGLAPITELLEKRTDFITEKQLYSNQGHPLSGGILCWDNRAQNVLALPNDMWGSGGYEGGVTDAQFMALKNLYQPDSNEIALLETYIHTWLRGKIQNPETNGVAWTVTRPERTERGYNYIHVLNLYDAMARVAATWPDICQNDVDHYLDLWIATFKAYGTREVRFRDLGLMGRGNIVNMPPLFRRFDREVDARAIEYEIREWVAYWVKPPAYPYGSELFFDNTGYETVALYCDYDVRHNLNLDQAAKDARKHLVTQTINVTEAGRGQAPTWFWNDSDQRWWDAVRTNPKYETFTDFGENCHHYMTGLNGYMLLDLYDRGYNRDDTLPVGFSGMLTHLGRIADTGFAGMCFCPDPSSDNYGLNQFTGDVGLGLWGGLLGLRAYVLEPKDGEPVVLGGKLTGTAAAGVSLTPWAGNDHRVRWMAEKPVFFDVEGQVIRSITRKEGGNRWIIKLENNSKVSSRSRLSIAGLEPGTWSVSHRINKGSELESNRKEITEDEFVLERKLRPGTKVELILAREISE